MRFRFLLLFICATHYIFAQNISGTITDEFDQAVPEVTVLNISKDQHTHTDKYGRFVMENVSEGDTLYFSHLIYESATHILNDLSKELDLQLNSKLINLNEIVISPKTNALRLISDIDIQSNPVKSSQEILQKLPGLFIGQHAGGGKAEQIFLRGFDVDLGTDINITVDGLPVNMVSHAHGQGYADLHFVIPEVIDNVNFGKGPYYLNQGNFNTAGYVNFRTRNILESSSVKLEAGQFNNLRLMSGFNVLNNNIHKAYVATEYIANDGPFESPQNFNRLNLFGKYTGFLNQKDKIGISVSHFESKWDASGQIPQRAVNDGSISRFGAIDDTEGGNTSRSNVLIDYNKFINRNTSLNTKLFLSQYDFELYSNFTFFLEDQINGDQIRQKEKRTIYGLQTEYKRSFDNGKLDGQFISGLSFRNDQVFDNELSHSLNRSETLNNIQLGDVNERNLGAYTGVNLNTGKWTFNPSVRLDYFNFQYNDALITQYQTQSEDQAIVSPKFNVLYNQSNKLQFYLKTGKGFHSNDTRVVVSESDKKTIPAAYGADIGFIWKPTPKMLLNTTLWHLFLEQEFVYVGDAGIVEPSGKTQRQGIDLSYRYQPLPWLFWNFDANYTFAQAMDEPEGENYIPLAPQFTVVNGVNIVHKSGVFGGLNIRHIGDRPANEDNSIVAEGYTIADLNAGYQWNNLNIGFQIQNLLNSEWNETQFATESRLQDEIEPVEEIHFTPGTPFFIRSIIEYRF